jgi:hypothetical protein
MNLTLPKKNQSYTEWCRADLHISECTFALRWKVGDRVCTPRKSWCHAMPKPVQWKWIGGLCSVCMNDKQPFHVLGITWPVLLPGLMVLLFLVWGYLKECVYRNRECAHTHMRVHKHTHAQAHNTGAKACLSGWDCNHKSRTVAQAVLTVL